MDDAQLDQLGAAIAEALPGVVTGHAVWHGMLTLTAETARIVEAVTLLRDDPRFRFVSFTDVTAVDYPGRPHRFEVVYHFLSPYLNTRLRIKAAADETTLVPSIIKEFPGADWFEREVFDLY